MLRRIRQHLRGGGVIAYATESCFGFGCDPNNQRALQNILRLKHRPQSKGMIVIGARFEALRNFLQPLNKHQRARLDTTWPGAHTWLIPASVRAKPALRGQHRALAVRVPAHRAARELCTRLSMAIVSTSANRAGQRPVKTTRDCLRRFATRVLVVPGKIGARKLPSTIQDLKTGKILR
jgi:L-threonylcarbamoyladenylate synthase